uniref:Uncharacterized protein n=1 Tax=Arundo donax TaxID=35708 RepID=A0A0A9A3D7_ARUDO
MGRSISFMEIKKRYEMIINDKENTVSQLQ